MEGETKMTQVIMSPKGGGGIETEGTTIGTMVTQVPMMMKEGGGLVEMKMVAKTLRTEMKESRSKCQALWA